MKNIFYAFALMSVYLSFAVSAISQVDTRASRTWEVQKYDISATLPATETDRYLSARATLNLRNATSAAANSLTLRISPLAEVSAVKVNGATTDFTKGEEKVGSGTLQRIIIRGIAGAPNASVAVEVDYRIKVAENSGVAALSPAGSQFLPLSFWYPTPNSWFFARGADFAPVRLKVSSATGQTFATSGSESGGVYDQKFNVQPFFVVGNWDTSIINGVTMMLPKGAGADEQKRAGELAAMIAEVRTYLSSQLGQAADFPLRVVAVRRGAGFAGGGTILVDEGVFRRPKLDSLTVTTVTESLAKFWLGGVVRVEGDGSGVIREGLPRFLAAQFLESKFGQDIADLERTRQRTAYAAVVKRDAPLTTVSPLDDYYFTTNANKGAMIWRLLAKKLGAGEFFNVVKEGLKDGIVDLAELRTGIQGSKEFLDYAFDQVTDMDLLVGLPSTGGAETKVNLRNTGSVDAIVEVVGTNAAGEKFRASATIPKQNFGSVSFPAANKVIRAEVDGEKLFPQLDYSNDVAPREFDESDLLLFVKKPFDKQDFAAAEKNARAVLRDQPRFDDVRVLLGRALLAQNRTADAEREFRAVIDERLPTARSLAWATVGLGEAALKSNQTAAAIEFYNAAIRGDAEFGATLAARAGKVRANAPLNNDDGIKAYFGQFDKAAISGSKATLEALVLAGEVPRFASGIAGQAQSWTTKIVQIDKVNVGQAVVEVSLDIKMLNRDPESGTAVFRLTMIGGVWKLSGVDTFEVR